MILHRPNPMPLLPIIADALPCWLCRGGGRINWQPCLACHGTGDELANSRTPDEVRAIMLERALAPTTPTPTERGIGLVLLLAASPALVALAAALVCIGRVKGWL